MIYKTHGRISCTFILTENIQEINFFSVIKHLMFVEMYPVVKTKQKSSLTMSVEPRGGNHINENIQHEQPTVALNKQTNLYVNKNTKFYCTLIDGVDATKPESSGKGVTINTN